MTFLLSSTVNLHVGRREPRGHIGSRGIWGPVGIAVEVVLRLLSGVLHSLFCFLGAALCNPPWVNNCSM